MRSTRAGGLVLALTVAGSSLLGGGIAAAETGQQARRLVAAGPAQDRVTAAALGTPGTAAATQPPADVTSAMSSVGALPPFRTVNFPLPAVSRHRLPYQSSPAPLTPADGPIVNGIMKYRHPVTGRIHDHPVRQATFVLGLLASYEQNGDARFLRRAIANGERLLETSVRSRGALFYPYPFDFALHRITRETLRKPWYSAMAQGQVLAALLRLERTTGDARWRRAARDTFVSFTLPRTAGVPWVVNVDASNLLWLEEYPDERHSDRAYNGHNYAIYGLYEYWWVTKDPDAARLVRGSLTAADAYAPSIRRPGQLSRYCLRHDVRVPRYHNLHVRQLYVLSRLSGDVRFARWGDRFLADAPAHYSGGRGRIGNGTHLMLSRTASGAVRNRRTVRIARAYDQPFDQRARINGQPGVWLRLSRGAHAGLWVREDPRRAFLYGRIERFSFSPERRVTFPAGTHVGYRIGPDGFARPARQLRLSRTSSAPSGSRAIHNGAPYLEISKGYLAGLLVRADGPLRLT